VAPIVCELASSPWRGSGTRGEIGEIGEIGARSYDPIGFRYLQFNYFRINVSNISEIVLRFPQDFHRFIFAQIWAKLLTGFPEDFHRFIFRHLFKIARHIGYRAGSRFKLVEILENGGGPGGGRKLAPAAIIIVDKYAIISYDLNGGSKRR
jgi:hypothetical protein